VTLKPDALLRGGGLVAADCFPELRSHAIGGRARQSVRHDHTLDHVRDNGAPRTTANDNGDGGASIGTTPDRTIHTIEARGAAKPRHAQPVPPRLQAERAHGFGKTHDRRLHEDIIVVGCDSLPLVTEPLTTVKQFWDRLYARDWDGIKAFFTDDSVYYDVPTGGLSAARGGDRIEARLRLGIEPLSDYRHHLRTIAAEGDVVFTEHQEDWYFHTGEVVKLPFVSVQHVEGGHITLWKDYWDLQTLLSAAPREYHERLDTADLSWMFDATGLA
jgi:limonene-1,2-epoxide hydrolase